MTLSSQIELNFYYAIYYFSFINNELNLSHIKVYGFDYDVCIIIL